MRILAQRQRFAGIRKPDRHHPLDERRLGHVGATLLERPHLHAGAPSQQEKLVRLQQEGGVRRFTIGLVALVKSLVDLPPARQEKRRQQVQARPEQEVGHDHDLEPLGRKAPPSGFQVFHAGLEVLTLDPVKQGPVTIHG